MQRARPQRPIHSDAERNAGPITKANYKGYRIHFCETKVMNQPMMLIGIWQPNTPEESPPQRYLAAGHMDKQTTLKAAIRIAQMNASAAADNN